MEVNISNLTWDQFIYPRGGKSEKTINAYIEALAIGAQFPPINIQKVFNYSYGNETTEATIILDGIHRWSAFKESGIKKIAAVEWKEKPLDYEKDKVAFLLEGAECNIRHGDRCPAENKQKYHYPSFEPPWMDSGKNLRHSGDKATKNFSNYQ